MRDFAYYNGVITPYDAATVPLSDRALFFADAVYDVILGRNGIPYQAELHYARLLANAQAIGLCSDVGISELREAVRLALDEAEADDFTLYVQLSASEKRRLHKRCEGATNLLITVTHADIPYELSEADAITLPDLRYGYCNLKTTNLLPAVLSVCDAEALGADTAIFHKDSLVTEASSANVSIITGDLLLTHPLDSEVLPGISELSLIAAATAQGLTHSRRKFTVGEMMGADAVLISSTTKLVRLCRSVDGTELSCRGRSVAEAIFSTMLDDLLVKTT